MSVVQASVRDPLEDGLHQKGGEDLENENSGGPQDAAFVTQVSANDNSTAQEDDTGSGHAIYAKDNKPQAPLGRVIAKAEEKSIASGPGAGTKLFRDGYEAQATDVFIAIMGVTGSGKSTFIAHCTEKELEIGHGLQGCTRKVSVYLCQYRPDVNVYLIDTPGFDDTNRSDTEVLKEIAAWLTASYSFSIRLHGIIYLHRVLDLRMQGSAKRNLFLFKKLCGREALKHVILATTMWEKVDEKDGVVRERELEETPEFWGLMKEKGSRILRHYNNRESAMRLLELLVSKPPAESRIVLDVQSQMVDGGKTLAETDAGQEMDSTLTWERTKYEEELAQTRADKQEALELNDPESATLLDEHEQETDERIRQLQAEQENLKITMERLHQEKLAELQTEMERIRNENRQTIVTLEKTRQQSEEERAIFERERSTSLNVERTLSRNLEETQKRLTQLAQEPSPAQSHAARPDTSVALFGVYYFFVATTKTLSAPPPGFPTTKQIPNGRTRYVAIGDQGSYYIHYHTLDDSCCTLLSKNFARIYPGAYKHIIDNKQFGCPTCVSLGTNGNGFVRTEAGVWHNLRRSTTTKLGDIGEIEGLWLGSNGAYVALRKDGTTVWDLKGGYPDLHVCLQLVCHAPGMDGSAIKALAMNPHDTKQWIVVFQDGQTSFNEGKGYTFDGSVYTKWCNENFNTMKMMTHELPTDENEQSSELDPSQVKVELDTVREAVELEAGAPPLPPRSPDGPVELEDKGGPAELPADTGNAVLNKQTTVRTGTLRNRLSKLRLHRRTSSPVSGTDSKETRGR